MSTSSWVGPNNVSVQPPTPLLYCIGKVLGTQMQYTRDMNFPRFRDAFQTRLPHRGDPEPPATCLERYHASFVTRDEIVCRKAKGDCHVRGAESGSDYVVSFSVRTSRQMYAETLKAVNTDTTLPDVRNFFLCRPSSPTSEKNCLFPIRCQHPHSRRHTSA